MPRSEWTCGTHKRQAPGGFDKSRKKTGRQDGGEGLNCEEDREPG